MTTTVLLARHGETDWNRGGRFQGHADPPLNDTGREQAAALAERLASAGVTAVHTSDLRRAAQTAEIVAARLGLPVAYDARLREVDVGEFQGLTRSEIEERWPDAQARFEQRGWGWERGETLEALADRVVAALLDIATANDGGRVLAVGHGGTIRSALARAAGLDPVAHRRLVPGPFGNGDVFELQVEDGVLRPVAAADRAGR